MATIEKYSDRDFAASDLDLSTIEPSKKAIIEYNQNEFKSPSSYCTAYACFANYSRYTGLEIPKEWRKEFIDLCLEKELIINGVGGFLIDVVNEFRKFISIKTEIDFSFARVYCDDREISNLFGTATGFRGNSAFKKDRQDNCIIDNYDFGEGTWGHGITEFEYKYTQDNYSLRECNIYAISDYQKFVTSNNHFKNGYFFYRMKIDKQLEKDIADIQEAFDLGIITKDDELKKVKAGIYDTDVKTTLKIMRARRI